MSPYDLKNLYGRTMVFEEANHEEILIACKSETIFVISRETGLEYMSWCEGRLFSVLSRGGVVRGTVYGQTSP